MDAKEIKKFLVERNCPKSRGFAYIQVCIQRYIEDNSAINYMKNLYEHVVATCPDTGSTDNVERCIRSFIGVWFAKNQIGMLFNNRPTNRDCIVALADFIVNSRPHDSADSIYELAFR